MTVAGMMIGCDGYILEPPDLWKTHLARLSKPSGPITLETVAGHHVIVEHRRGPFAPYTHLQPRSVYAKVGDRVRRGHVLGGLESSDNSDAPPLHVHRCDTYSPLGCEGPPYVMERFAELPLEDQVVRFSLPPSRS